MNLDVLLKFNKEAIMPKIYEGLFNLQLNTRGELVAVKKPDGEYCAEDAELILKNLAKYKGLVNKWSFYVAGFNQTLGTDVHAFDPIKALAWVKRQGGEWEAAIGLGRFGGAPQWRLDPKGADSRKTNHQPIKISWK